MANPTYKLEEVFIPVGYPQTTFVTRENLEKAMKAWKLTKTKHLLIFGPSKAGKTTLWKKHIADRDSKNIINIIKLGCNSSKNIEEIYSCILYELGSFYLSEQGQESEKTGNLGTEFKAIFPGLEASLTGERGKSKSESRTISRLSSPIIDANTVIKFLKPSKKIVILEDFHYANENFKLLLSQDLKAFSDEKCPWILIGVKQRSSVSEILPYNMDLQQRIFEIPVEWFSDSKLEEIISLGEFALNIKFADSIKKSIVNESLGSAAILQNICLRICLNQEILVSSHEPKPKIINKDSVVEEACQQIAQEDKTSYQKFIEFIKKMCIDNKNNVPWQEFRWIFKLIKEKDIPENGLKITKIHRYIKDIGYEEADLERIANGLRELIKILKEDPGKLPILFDFDSDDTFFLLDKYMKFIFKWIPNLVDQLFV